MRMGQESDCSFNRNAVATSLLVFFDAGDAIALRLTIILFPPPKVAEAPTLGFVPQPRWGNENAKTCALASRLFASSARSMALHSAVHRSLLLCDASW
jgi:hypothetical protein